MYIKGEDYSITPAVIAEALQVEDVLRTNKRTVKDWIKDYSSKAEVKALEESLCWLREAKWQGKKDRFHAALT